VKKAWLSPPLEDSIETRWGLKKCERIRIEIRATHDSIDFIEKTYRKKDPEYADFSIRQQEHMLGRLSEEWTRFGCKELPQAPTKKRE
jgi:hypothetical protein